MAATEQSHGTTACHTSENATIIDVEEFIVAPGETLTFVNDLVIRADRVIVGGVLAGGEPQEAEPDGPSLCVEAGQLVLTGTLCAGDARDRDSAAGSVRAGNYTGASGSPGGTMAIHVPAGGIFAVPGALLCSGTGGAGQTLTGFPETLTIAGTCSSTPTGATTLNGGIGGNAGDIIAAPEVLAALTDQGASVELGNGGDGGGAYLLFGNFAGGSAYGGTGGASGHPGLEIGTFLADGTGGSGGNAISVPCPEQSILGDGGQQSSSSSAPQTCLTPDEQDDSSDGAGHPCVDEVLSEYCSLNFPDGPPGAQILCNGENPCNDEIGDCLPDCEEANICAIVACVNGAAPCPPPADCLAGGDEDDSSGQPCVDAIVGEYCALNFPDGPPGAEILCSNEDPCIVDDDCLPAPCDDSAQLICALVEACLAGDPPCTVPSGGLCETLNLDDDLPGGCPPDPTACLEPGVQPANCLIDFIVLTCYYPITYDLDGNPVSVCGIADEFIAGGSIAGTPGASYSAVGDKGDSGNIGQPGDPAGWSFVGGPPSIGVAAGGGIGAGATVNVCVETAAGDGHAPQQKPVDGAEASAGGGRGGDAFVKGGRGGDAYAKGGTGGSGGTGGVGGLGLIYGCTVWAGAIPGGDGAPGDNGADGGPGGAAGGRGGDAQVNGGDGGDASGDGSVGGNGGNGGGGGEWDYHWSCFATSAAAAGCMTKGWDDPSGRAACGAFGGNGFSPGLTKGDGGKGLVPGLDGETVPGSGGKKGAPGEAGATGKPAQNCNASILAFLLDPI